MSKFCGECGAQVEGKFCGNCGAVQEEISQNTTMNSQTSVTQNTSGGNVCGNNTNSNSVNDATYQQKKKSTALLFAIFLGGLGIHDFYVDNKRNGYIKLCITLGNLLITMISFNSFSISFFMFASMVRTVAGIGILVWIIVDIVQIASNKVKDGKGNPLI